MLRFDSTRWWTATAGANNAAFAFTTADVIWRSGAASNTQMLRPWVATTMSPVVGCCAISWTATVGRLLFALVQLAPRFADTQMPNSVPVYRKSLLWMSSRQTRVEPHGRLLAIGFHVA